MKGPSLKSIAPGSGRVAIGSRLAEALGAYPGSEISLISPEGRSTVVGTVPRIVSYTVGSGTHTDVVARHVSANGVVGAQFNLEHPTGGSFEPQADSHLATLSNGNVVAVTIVPGPAAGAPAHVVVDPPSPYFTIAGRVVTSTSGPQVPTVDTKEEPAHTRVNVAKKTIAFGLTPESNSQTGTAIKGSVIGMCATFEMVLGGFIPEMWGAGSFSVQSLLFSGLGGVAGIWAGGRIAEM